MSFFGRYLVRWRDPDGNCGAERSGDLKAALEVAAEILADFPAAKVEIDELAPVRTITVTSVVLHDAQYEE